jgi:hypothetical protein
MAGTMIGALRVALGLDTAQFEAGANKAAHIARSKSKEMTDSFAGARKAVEGLFAAFTVGLITEQVKKSLEYAGSLAEVARTLGLTTKDLQTFRYAATQTGVAQDQLEVGLRRLTVSMGKAQLGSKEQIKAFNAIGISVDQLKGKSTGDVFRLIADGLSKVTDRSQRAAVEMTLMGRSGSTLDNLLAPGARRLNELAQAAQQLGIVLSDQQIQGAEETAHKLAAVKEVLAAQIAGVVASNANAILSLSSALATLTGQVIRFLGSNPQLALAIVGGLAGGRIGGAAGAIAGAAGGAILGGMVAQSAADGNMDLGFRTQQMRAAQNEYFQRLQFQQGGGLISIRHGNGGGASGATVKSAQDEFFRQLGLLKSATAQARAGALPQPKGVDLPKFLAGGEKKPKKTPRDKNEADEFQFAQAQRQADLEILQAKRDLSHDYVEQTSISIQMLDVQKAIRDAEIDHKVAQAQRDLAEGKITKATLDEITAQAKIAHQKEDTLDHLKRRAVLDAEAEQRFHDVAQLDQQALDLRRGHLQDELSLATTAEERRDLELKILDIDYQIQKAKLEEVLADSQATEQAKELARRGLADLTAGQAVRRQAVIQQTQGPLEDYISKLPGTVAKFNESVQLLEVQGIDGLLDDITQLQGGFKSLLKSLLNTALQFAQGFAKLGLERGVAPLLGALTGRGAVNLAGSGIPSFASFLSGGGGGGGDGVVDLTGAQFASSFPHFAGGGSMVLKGNMGTDRNLLSLNGLPIAKVSYGEPISISSRANSSSGDAADIRRAPVNMTVITPNADSFNRSGRQVVRQLRRTLR